MADGIPHASARRIFQAVFVSVVVLMTSAASGLVAHAQPTEGTVRLVPSISSAPVKDGNFTTFIVMENLKHVAESSVGLAAFEFTIEYDETVVEVVSAEMGPALETTGRTFQCLPPNRDEPGVFRFGCVSIGVTPDGRQGSFTLAEVRLLPIGRGSSPLLLDAQIGGPLGEEALLDVNGGAVTVTGTAFTTPKANVEIVTPTSTQAAADSPLGTDIPESEATTSAAGATTPSPAATFIAGATLIAGDSTATTSGENENGVEDGEKTPLGLDDPEAQSGDLSGPDAKSSGNTLRWAFIVLGSLTAVAALAVSAVLWRRRRS